MDTVQICNQAIGWLGGNRITSLDDGTTEANLCKDNFEFLRDAVLETVDWSFAKKQVRLTPLTTTPAFRFDQQFLQPADVLRIITAGAKDDFTDILEWEPGVNDSNQQVVYANNTEVLYLLYVSRQEETTKFPPLFAQALAQRLAADLAIPLTENAGLANRYWQLYERKVIEAANSDGVQGPQQRIKSGTLRNIRKYDRTYLGYP